MATRLYLHDTVNALSGTFPTTPQGRAADWMVVGGDTLRVMNTTKGTSQTSRSGTSLPQSTAQFGLLGMWTSPALAAYSTTASLTSIINFAAAENNAFMDFCEDVRLDLYVWRPSTGSIVGSAATSASTWSGDAEPNAINTEKCEHATRSAFPSSIAIQDGDVLIVEVWSRHLQSNSNAHIGTVYYDGTVETTLTNTTVSDHAAFLEVSWDLSFLSTGISASAGFTLGALTSSADASVALSASAGFTLGSVALSAAAGVALSASAGFTLGSVSLAATAVTVEERNADASFTLAAVTLAAAAGVAVSASAGVTLATVGLAATTSVAVSASAGVTLATVALSAAATVDAPAPAPEEPQTDDGAGSGAAAPRRVFQIPVEEPRPFSLDDLYPPVTPPPATESLVHNIALTPLAMAMQGYAPATPRAPVVRKSLPPQPVKNEDDEFYELATLIAMIL